MKKRGFVSKVNEDSINVVVIRESACGGNCASCGSCESKPIDLTLKTDKNYCVGDIVELEIDDSKYVGLLVLMYLLPLIALFIGFMLSAFVLSDIFNYESDLINVMFGFIFLLITFFINRNIDKKSNTEQIIKIM